MKLSFAKKYNYIPQLTDDEILKVCKKLGIPAKDMSYDAAPEEIDRLKYNSELQLLGAAKAASITHAKVLSDYDTTIEKYNALISSLESKPQYATDKTELEAIRDHLIEIRDYYSSISTNLDVKSESLDNYSILDNAMYDPTISDYGRFKISFQNKLAQIRGKQLEKQYEKLDDLTGLEHSSKIARTMNREKILKTQTRILKLKQKQGKLLSSQKRIVSQGSQKYITNQSKELKLYYKNVNREIRAFAELDDINESIINTLMDVKAKKDEITRLTGVAGAEARVSQLESDINRLETKIQSLQEKEGIVRSQNQFARESLRLRGMA